MTWPRSSNFYRTIVVVAPVHNSEKCREKLRVVFDPSGLYYPNRIARHLLLAMEDVMGKSGLNTILSLATLEHHIDHLPSSNLTKAFDFAEIAAISEALESMYGARGGRGIALRVGRATFARGMKGFGAMAGMNDPAFHALPLENRSWLGLNALAAIFSNFSDQQSAVHDMGTTFELVTEIAPPAWGRNTDKPVCHLLTGIVQESLRWSSNGHEYHVREVECRASGGDACVFVANKRPIA